MASAVELADRASEADEPFDIILVDVAGRDGDRDDLADRLPAAHAERSRLVLMTSFLGGGTASHTPGGYEISGRVRKPVRADALLSCIKSALGIETPEDMEGEETARADEEARRRMRQKARVLVVEDNEVNQAVVMSMLDKLGYHAAVVDNGLSALDALEEDSFDLVLMDCQMPGMDGYETTRLIRDREETGARLPVIALTANALAGDAQKCLDAGMDAYLSKPFEAAVLERTLDAWILGSVPLPATLENAAQAVGPLQEPAQEPALPPVDPGEVPVAVRRAL